MNDGMTEVAPTSESEAAGGAAAPVLEARGLGKTFRQGPQEVEVLPLPSGAPAGFSRNNVGELSFSVENFHFTGGDGHSTHGGSGGQHNRAVQRPRRKNPRSPRKRQHSVCAHERVSRHGVYNTPW